MTYIESVITSRNYLPSSYTVFDCYLTPLFGRVGNPNDLKHYYILTEEATNYYYQEHK